MPSPVAETSIEIHAPERVVWSVMLDLARYREWNPFIVDVAAPETVAVGSRLRLSVRWSDGGTASSGEIVTKLDAPTDGNRQALLEYRFTGWLARLALVRATRSQTLERTAQGGTRYHTREQFGGLLAGAIPLKKVQDGFERHAQALKARAEKLARG